MKEEFRQAWINVIGIEPEITTILSATQAVNILLECESLLDKTNRDLLLKRAVEALDDYLNAGSKDTRAKAAEKAKQVYQEYHGKEYKNRNER